MPSRKNSIQEASRLLSKACQPAYVLDADRKLVGLNAACGQWLGIDIDTLLDVECGYHSQAEGESIEQVANGLCPPPQALTGIPCQGKVLAGTRDAWFMPLHDDDGEMLGVLCIVHADSPESPPEDATFVELEDLHLQLQRLRVERQARWSAEQFIGVSAAAKLVSAQSQLAADSLAAATIVGVRGSRREALARAIHARGVAAAGTLVPLACPLADEDLMEATLAALTRAERGGETAPTLLLLDVDELPSEMQSSLAQFLQQSIRRLRTLSTSATLLTQLAAEGKFHAGLASTLATLAISLPPLSRRKEDVPLLAQHYLEKCNASGGKQLAGLSEEALDCLSAHSWPGDVAELAEIVRHAHGTSSGSVVALSDLPPALRTASVSPPVAEESIQLEPFLAALELEIIQRALKQAKGNKTQAAKLLGLSRSRFHRRLLQLGLESPAETPDDAISFEEI